MAKHDMNTNWQPVDQPPKQSGKYIVGNPGWKTIGEARWMPKRQKWVFPSYGAAFEVKVWTTFPELPNAD